MNKRQKLIGKYVVMRAAWAALCFINKEIDVAETPSTQHLTHLPKKWREESICSLFIKALAHQSLSGEKIERFFVKLLREGASQIPHFSGDKKFFVPNTKDFPTPKNAWENTTDMWAGKYGKIRRQVLVELIEHFYDETQKLNNKLS